MKKLNLAQKISCKLLALLLITLVFVTLFPITALADNVDNNAYTIKNLTANYDSSEDTVEFTWEAPESSPYELWLCADEKLQKIEDVSSTVLSYPCDNGGEQKYYILSITAEDDLEGVKSEEVTVNIPYTLVGIETIDELTVENNLTAREISRQLPKKIAVQYADGEKILSSDGNKITWDTKNVNYDRESATEQVITMVGKVTIADENIVNRNELPLECSVSVKVKAATPISIVTNLDNTSNVEKKAGEELILSIETAGTVQSYQWYMKAEGAEEGTPIKKETKATFRVGALSLNHSASYYCVITGKDGNEIKTNEIVVKVSEKNFFEKLHKTFIEQNGLNDILSGLGNTLLITAGALVLGVIIGVIIAIAKYFSEDVPALKPISWICDIYVTVIRGIPVTVLLIITFFIIMSTVQNGLIPAIITFGINSGAYMAEIIRSGINAVDKGQMEAGRSLGMTKMQAMGKIILPQAVRYILPAIGNEFIALLKETSVAGYVAVEDLTRMGNIVSAHTYDVMNPRLLVALIYLVLVVMLSQALNFVERRLAKNDKRK